MNPDTTTDTGPSGLALPLALVTELAASAPAAAPRPAEIHSGDSRKRRAARRRAAAVRG